MGIAIQDQVVVITGASSGIGRETAIAFGMRGASVVLAARSETALAEVAREVERLGGKALPVPVDVGDWPQVERLAEAAIARFGRIDTWVNNAAVSAYAMVEAMEVEEIDRIVRVNLLGQIYGMKAVLPHFRRQHSGTIINVASALAERAVPLQATYCATKHGIKGFTEALRLELKHEQSGIDVVLVLPSSINTPFFEHARSKLGVLPMPIPPVYGPRVVARAIVASAEHPCRDLYVGGGGRLFGIAQRISPALLDWYMLQGGRMFRQQRSDKPDDERDNLFAPEPGTGASTGEFDRASKPVSFYTRLFGVHPNRERLAAGAMLAGGVALMRRFGR